MDAQPRTSTVAKTVFLVFILSVIALLLMAPHLTSSSARVQEKRVFENAIPDRVPIKIKIKKEKIESFENLKNEKWLSQFELELTNTGDKPIYFIYITMGTGVKWGGTGDEVVSPLWYGRAELGDIVTKAGPDDVPIKPGETYVLKMGEVAGWEMGVGQKLFDQAKKLRAELQVISFGDGTGYFGTEPYPPPGRPRQSALNERNQQRKETRTKPPGALGPQLKGSSITNKPTSSAKFLFSEKLKNAHARVEPQPDTTCQF